MIAAIAILAALSLPDRIVRIDGELKAGQFEPAQRELAALDNTITEHFGSGSQAMYTIALIATFRALAAAGAKDLNDAEWYWSIARSLFPKFAGSNLAVYGAAGEAVMRLDRSDACQTRDLPSGSRVTPPKPSHSPMPPYPYHALETGIAEPITVEVTVTENGTTRCPKVIETHDDPALAWVLLEAMKKWRYEPARVDGAPVPATVRQTVDFRIKYY